MSRTYLRRTSLYWLSTDEDSGRKLVRAATTLQGWSDSRTSRQESPVPLRSTNTTIRTLDGLHLDGTLVTPDSPTDRAVVFVHGGGVTREEGGFFTRLATGLGEAGVASLRYDLRGHGQSDGPQQETTLATHLNDIRVALADLREATGASATSLLGASFGGGLCAYYAAKRREELTRLVLLNPQLNYKDRYIDQKPHWSNDHLSDEAARQLQEHGYINHSPTVKHGRAMLNEVFWIRPNLVLGEIQAPTLIVHGTKDTFVSIDASRAAAQQLRAEHQLVEIEGAQHGFAVHDDPQYLNPQSQEWQAFVIRTVTEWIKASA
jgi:alpha-beta hydrolase superfamily lysophospholipase